MSPKLQGEVLLHCNHKWIKRVDFLQGVDDEFVAALVCSLWPPLPPPLTFSHPCLRPHFCPRVSATSRSNSDLAP